MAWLSLCLYAQWLVVIGFRVWILYRRTRTTGIRRLTGPPWSVEGATRGLMTLAFAAGFAGPLADLADALPRIGALDHPAASAVGVVLAVAGMVVTTAAQFGMGSSWRVGVDPGERTELVTGGLFSVVRHPIYSAIVVALAGLALMVPNAASVAGVALMVVGAEIQARRIEEPFMLSKHGDAYAAYRRRVGRFVPGVGRVWD